MLCSGCNQNEATRCLRQEGEDDVWLCDDCYERLGGAAACFGDEPDFFVSFLQPKKDDEKKCPVCGRTLTDYSRTGLVGCASCYEAFREELMPAIRRIHGKTVHKGKHPLGSGSSFELLGEQKRLRAELERALRENRMKDAERLNRDIRAISDVIYRGGEGKDGK